MHEVEQGPVDKAPFRMDQAIIPFNLAEAAKLLSSGLDSQQRQPLSSLSFSKEQLMQLHLEASEYVENLDTTLRSLFANDNAKLRKRIVDTSNIPSTFLYMRLQQQMLALTGDNSLAKQRETLANLAQLME